MQTSRVLVSWGGGVVPDGSCCKVVANWPPKISPIHYWIAAAMYAITCPLFFLVTCVACQLYGGIFLYVRHVVTHFIVALFGASSSAYEQDYIAMQRLLWGINNTRQIWAGPKDREDR